MSLEELVETVENLHVVDGGISRANKARADLAKIEDIELRQLADYFMTLVGYKVEGCTTEPTREESIRLQIILAEAVPSKLDPFFAAIFGELGEHVAAAYQHLRDMPLRSLPNITPVRAPQLTTATACLRWFWLLRMAGILYRFPCGLLTPEWLAVHGAGITQPTTEELVMNVKPPISELQRSGRKPTDGVREVDYVGQLLGSVIAGNSPTGENVFETLMMIAEGKHPSGVESSHLYRAFWRSGQSRCHDILLEILNESDDEARVTAIAQAAVDGGPKTMSMTLQPVLKRGLLANDDLAWSVGHWFGTALLSMSREERATATEPFAMALHERQPGLDFTVDADAPFEGSQAFVLLVLTALDDVANVPGLASQLIDRVADKERDLVTRAIQRIALPDEVLSDAAPLWLRLLEDDDLQVAAAGIWWQNGIPPVELGRRVEVVSSVLSRLSKQKGLLVPDDPSTTVDSAREAILKSLADIVDEIPFAKFLGLYYTAIEFLPPDFHRRLTRLKIQSEQERELVLSLLDGDYPNSLVAALVRHRLSLEDMSWLSEFLKSSEYRKGAIAAIAQAQPNQRAAFVDMLLADSKTKTREYGLKVLNVMAKEGESLEWVTERAAEFSTRKKITNGEQAELRALSKKLPEGSIPAPKKEVPVDLISNLSTTGSEHSEEAPVPQLRRLEIKTDREGIQKCFSSLRKVYDQYADTVVRREFDGNVRVAPLGEMNLGGILSSRNRETRKVNESFPLAETWLAWFQAEEQRWLHESLVLPQIFLSGGMRGRWGEYKPTEEAANIIGSSWIGTVEAELVSIMPLVPICRWLAIKNPTAEGANFLLDAFENFLTSVPEDYWRGQGGPAKKFGGLPSQTSDTAFSRFLRVLEDYFAGFGNKIPADVTARRWLLARAVTRPPFVQRPPAVDVAVMAFGAGAASSADLYEYWIDDAANSRRAFDKATKLESRLAIARFAGTRCDEYLTVLDQFADETIDKLLAEKSETKQAFSKVATRIRSVHGIERLLRLLKALGKKKLARWNCIKQNNQTRDVSIIGQLIAFSSPAPGEPFEQFAAAVEQSKKWLTRERLLQLSMFATQWSYWIERVLEIPGLQDAAEWLATHSPDSTVHQTAAMYFWHNTGRLDVGESWDSFPLQPEDEPRYVSSDWRCTRERFGAGHVPSEDHLIDVAQEWYQRAFARVGKGVWFELESVIESVATKKNADFLLELTKALRGESDRAALRSQIETEPKPEAVQLLALAPVAQGTEREADLAERMRLIHEHRRLAKRQKVIMREKLLEANEQACKLLATGAGLSDPERLEWYAMADVQDRIDSISPLTIDEVTLELVVQPNGVPVILVDKGGKKQKSVPGNIKKDERVKGLQALLKELKTQAKQTARSLEEAMVAGSDFNRTELTRLIQNGLVGPPVSSLVFMQGDHAGTLTLTDGELNLVDHTGTAFSLGEELLQIAHVTDLMALKCLKEWRDQFADRVQAIEQVHRDLFLPSRAEHDTVDQCVTRFADYRIRPGQAHTIFGRMRWQTERRFGDAYLSRWDRKLNIWATIDLDYVDYTTDDLAVKKLWFQNAKGTVSLAKVPPRLLSETIREINQIVTTADIEQD